MPIIYWRPYQKHSGFYILRLHLTCFKHIVYTKKVFWLSYMSEKKSQDRLYGKYQHNIISWSMLPYSIIWIAVRPPIVKMKNGSLIGYNLFVKIQQTITRVMWLEMLLWENRQNETRIRCALVLVSILTNDWAVLVLCVLFF